MSLIIVLIGLAALVALIVGVGIGAYNGFVRQRNTIQESWRQVDVELNRRYELIPNLVETVRGAAAHESGTLENVIRLRNQAVQSSGGDAPDARRAEIESQLSGAVHNLMVQVEAYPQLQANASFVELQRQLAETEDRIAAGRRYYNANVSAYNTRIDSFPSNLVASMNHFEKAAYFQVDNPEMRSAPTVNFGAGTGTTSTQPGIDRGTSQAAPGYEAPGFGTPSAEQGQQAGQTQRADGVDPR
ncbi:LemA family protein [Acidipropionibacterium timonense]|uniref:LemA family protein n=1 Tax=Acidipropionibacterium timonense TaxID=2161818 RepID=UPI0010304AF0|nr:LemA family protein [Acidipropionibacterium timonense]